MLQPLKSYFIHGHASGGGDGQTGPSDVPYVLFGSNTSQQALDKASKVLCTPDGNLNTAAVGKHAANFMVITSLCTCFA